MSAGAGRSVAGRIVPAAAARYAGTTVGEARAILGEALCRTGTSAWREDARRLVAHAVGARAARIGLERERRLTADEAERLATCERERMAGRSVGRIVGHRPFHDIVLDVAEGVLEPRDDTGALVELALPLVRTACEERSTARVLDVGVGAGTVILAILSAESRATGVATDINPAALDATRRNAATLGVDGRLTLVLADTFGHAGDGPYDVIASNPPYIRTGDMDGLAPEVRADPVEALDGGPDGLRFYRALAKGVADHLRPGGVLAVEIGAGRGPDVRRIMARHGWREVGATDDLGGHERALAFRPRSVCAQDGVPATPKKR